MGDTDFKVAGTRNSITALQVCCAFGFPHRNERFSSFSQADIKNMEGLPLNIVKEALQAAKSKCDTAI